MALPTSTIVMAVLTCVPFGLAIRDTVNGTAPVARGDDGEYGSDDSDDYEAEYAAAEARRVALEAEEEATERLEQAQHEQLRVARRSLFGAEVATLGSGFDGISLGMNEDDIRLPAVAALENATDVDVELLSNGTLDWILIKPEDDASEDDSSELCTELGQDLQDAWGRGKTEDYERRYWVNPIAKTRVSLSAADGCRLSFDRYAEPKDWVSKAKTSIVPIWLVGQPIAKLREHIGTRTELENTDSEASWLGLGVGTGSGEARFQAHLAKGKVVAVTAAADTLDATREDIVAQLTALYGAPIEDDDGVHWKSRPAIQVTDYEGAGVRVTVGKIPDSE